MDKCIFKSNWVDIRNRINKEQELSKAEAELSPTKPKTNILTFTETRATSWKNNKRVKFADEYDENDTARKLFIKGELMKTAEEYVKMNCNEDGSIKNNNISVTQEKSIKDLKKRVKDENLVIYQTDKTNNFVVGTLDNAEHKMQKHLKNDEVISAKKIRSIDRQLNSEADDWIEIL